MGCGLGVVGQEVARQRGRQEQGRGGSGAEGAGGGQEGGKEGRREAGLRTSSVPAPTLTHHAHVHSSGDVYVQGRASPLTHTCPWMQGVAVLRHPRVLEASPAEPPPSPGSVLPALRGQLCWAGVS